MDDNKRITSRLDAIIFFMYNMVKENESFPKFSELLHHLKQVGMTNEELAGIFGKTPDQIAKTAYEFKRPTKNKGKEGVK